MLTEEFKKWCDIQKHGLITQCAGINLKWFTQTKTGRPSETTTRIAQCQICWEAFILVGTHTWLSHLQAVSLGQLWICTRHIEETESKTLFSGERRSFDCLFQPGTVIRVWSEVVIASCRWLSGPWQASDCSVALHFRVLCFRKKSQPETN